MGKSTRHYIQDALRYYKTEQYEQGLIACDYAIRLNPTCARAYHGRGLILVQQRKYEDALKAYQKALELAPNNAKLHADMGELFFIRSDYEKSRFSYENAMKLDSKFADAYHDKAKMLVDEASSHCPQNRPKAIAVYKKALLFDPNNDEARSALSKLERVEESLRKGSPYIDIHLPTCRCAICVNYM